MAGEKLAAAESNLAPDVPVQGVVQQVVQAHFDIPQRHEHEADYYDHEDEVEDDQEHDDQRGQHVERGERLEDLCQEKLCGWKPEDELDLLQAQLDLGYPVADGQDESDVDEERFDDRLNECHQLLNHVSHLRFFKFPRAHLQKVPVQVRLHG